MNSKKSPQNLLPLVNPHACGIDVGDSQYDVAYKDKSGQLVVLKYTTFTEDLELLAQELVASGVTSVAIESTGIYWLNLYLILEQSGIEVYLVNARHVKNVTGRKKDDTDAIWLYKLHSSGLLTKSFQPESDIRELRDYIRHRKNLVRQIADSTRRMQKALQQMNIKLSTVISDITGKTGLSMIDAILGGERSPESLIAYKDARIKADDEVIKKSLKGYYRREYLFQLKQARESYKFVSQQIDDCDEQIKEVLLRQVAQVKEGDITDLGCKKKRVKKNAFRFEAKNLVTEILGVDLCEVSGISENSAVELLSEIGTDMSKWGSSKQFCAWLNLTPNTKISGGKILSSRMQKKKNHAGLTLRMSASTLNNAKNPLGDLHRRNKYRLGKQGAVVATAHKLGKIIYAMIKNKTSFDEQKMSINDEKKRIRKIKNLEKRLEKLKKVS